MAGCFGGWPMLGVGAWGFFLRFGHLLRLPVSQVHARIEYRSILARCRPCARAHHPTSCACVRQGRSSVVEQRPFKPKVVGSIPTAPTNHLPDWSGFNRFARGQKGADKAIDPVLVR